MALKSYTILPPGGWVYTQPETKWRMRDMGALNAAISQMMEHRRFNNLPGATREQCLIDLEQETCQRLGNNPMFCVERDAQKKTPLPTQPWVANLAATRSSSPSSLKGVVDGALILKDWLGAGGIPVADELAQARTNVCVNDCSDPQRQGHFHNKPPSFFQKITGEVARAIQSQMREKTNLGLKVEGEEKLSTCDCCGCHLPLKVWVPMEHIIKHTDVHQMQIFPKHCWMITENRRKNESLSTTATPTHEDD